MGDAKRVQVKPISRQDADRAIARWHYSGRSVQNSQVHLGAFLDGCLLGAMQFGPPMVRRAVLPLVSGSEWQNVVELNRMAFSDVLPRNAESRCLAVAFRLFGRLAPQVKWCISFSDGTQCGDGAIYRASGFVLTQVKESGSIWRMPSGELLQSLLLTAHWDGPRVAAVCKALGVPHRPRTLGEWRALGAEQLPGFMLRYVRFLDPSWASRLAVPAIPFSAIPACARMVRGVRVGLVEGATVQVDAGGASPTSTLQG